MLERVLEQQPALYAVLMENKEKHARVLLLDAGEWGVIEDSQAIFRCYTGTEWFKVCVNFIAYSSTVQAYLCDIRVEDKDSTILKCNLH